jgi:hypothetical protein
MSESLEPVGGPSRGAGAAPRLRRRAGVSARALVIGLLLAPPNVLFHVKALWVWGWFTGQESVFPNAVALLFALVAGNEVLKRLRPRLAFTAGEMITVYLMLATSTGLVCSIWHFGSALAGNISYPFWFATDENGWKTLVWPYLQDRFTIQDPGALEGFFLGGARPYTWRVLRAWGGPALWWTAFVTVLLWVCLCLNSIVRRRWSEEEKLPFPLVALPVHLADERAGLLRSPLWWVGLALSAALGLWNEVAGFLPSLPAIPVYLDYSSYVANHPPWNFLRIASLTWSPGAIGLCYLMPLDLAFSLFAFDLFWIAEHVLSGHLGWSTNPRSGFPYGDYQVAGSFIAILLAVLWLDRRFLMQVFRKAAGLRSALDADDREALPYRWAALGALLGVAALWWFVRYGGMSQWVAVVFLGLYFTMALVLSRVRAQLGPPSLQFFGATPDWILRAVAGTRAIGPRSLGMFALLNPFLKQQSSHPGPIQIEGLKMAEGGRMAPRRLALALMAVTVLTMVCYFWANLHVGFQIGMATGKANHWNLGIPRWNYEGLASDVRNPAGPDLAASAAMAFGLAFTLALMALKLRFAWWPLHPVAFPLALGDSIIEFTLAIFLTWLIKALLLRYGGLRAHRVALPFFLGLIVGEAVVYTLQAAIRLVLGMT